MKKPALSMCTVRFRQSLGKWLTRLGYCTNPKAVAAVVLAWPGVVATIARYVYPTIPLSGVDVGLS